MVLKGRLGRPEKKGALQAWRQRQRLGSDSSPVDANAWAGGDMAGTGRLDIFLEVLKRCYRDGCWLLSPIYNVGTLRPR